MRQSFSAYCAYDVVERKDIHQCWPAKTDPAISEVPIGVNMQKILRSAGSQLHSIGARVGAVRGRGSLEV